ncbi:MAG: hypothetical protein KDC92_13390 [Bacteroidetes bacterium]|nr:hypothetical protein [Bacteroidota bacterium]
MTFTWGFIVIFVIILFPGLLIRRLYFYGEFSSQFNGGISLLHVLAYSLFPGLFVAIISYLIFDKWGTTLDLNQYLLDYKAIINLENSKSLPKDLGDSLKNEIIPFLTLEYLLTVLIGIVSGPIVRILRLDYFKIFRFKNYWFYLISNQHKRLPKYRTSFNKNKKFLFTVADVLVQTETGNKLYSGIVVDYELEDNSCDNLSKIVLKETHRYSNNNLTNERLEIPGDLFVVDCKNLLNINFTYAYDDDNKGRAIVFKNWVYYSAIALMIAIIPLFIIQFDKIQYPIYLTYWEFSFIGKLLAYLSVVQIIHILNPFYQVDGNVHLMQWSLLKNKGIWLIAFMFLLYIVEIV